MSEKSANEQLEEEYAAKARSGQGTSRDANVALLAKQETDARWTRYLDEIESDEVRYAQSYFEACQMFMGYRSPVWKNMKGYLDTARIPVKGKREELVGKVLSSPAEPVTEESFKRKLFTGRNKGE